MEEESGRVLGTWRGQGPGGEAGLLGRMGSLGFDMPSERYRWNPHLDKVYQAAS